MDQRRANREAARSKPAHLIRHGSLGSGSLVRFRKLCLQLHNLANIEQTDEISVCNESGRLSEPTSVQRSFSVLPS